MSIILKARGIKSLTRNEMLEIAIPEATHSYCPISNREVIETALEELDRGGFKLKSEFHKSDGSMQKFVGGFIISGGNKEMDIMFGYKNSYDKSMSAAFAMGANIMICSNSVVTGEVSMIRKHTGDGNIVITNGISNGIRRLGENFLHIEQQLQWMKEIEVSKRTCAELIGRMYIEEQLITAHQLSVIKEEIYNESFDYGVEDTLYNLYQAVTYGLKTSHPRTWMEDHLEAHRFFSNVANSRIVVTPKEEMSQTANPFRQLSWLDEL